MLSSRATSGLSPPVLPDPNLEKLVLGHLAAAAREALNALADVPLTFASSEGHADASDGSASDQFSGAELRQQLFLTLQQSKANSSSGQLIDR